MKVVGLGANKVVAVDRDLDNLITSYHTYSNRIDSDPYVIFTTYYSIENHLVWPGAVNTYLQMMIGTEHDYTSEYAQQLALYNGVLDPILPLMIASNEYSKRTRTCVEYCVDNLTKDMSSLNDKNSIPLFNECKASHSHKCLSLKAKYAYDFDLIIQRLIDVGKYPDELWKVAQGHMLFAFVQSYMYRIIQPIYLALIETIKEKNVNNKRRISIEIEDLKKKMFSRYRNLLTCIDRIMYDNPIIDYSDQGITKILERIKEIK